MYLEKCGSVQELKKEYRHLSMIFHPDRGGDTAIMAAINSEYKRMMDILEHGGNKQGESTTYNTKENIGKKTRKPRRKTYYSGSAIKEFADRYTMQGGSIFRVDAVTCVFYGKWLKTVIVKEVDHPRMGKVYTTRFYNNIPKKYADIIGIAV